jgi:hypothetical protein
MRSSLLVESFDLVSEMNCQISDTNTCGTKHKHGRTIADMTFELFTALRNYIVVFWAVRRVIFYVVTKNMLLPSSEHMCSLNTGCSFERS